MCPEGRRMASTCPQQNDAVLPVIFLTASCRCSVVSEREKQRDGSDRICCFRNVPQVRLSPAFSCRNTCNHWNVCSCLTLLLGGSSPLVLGCLGMRENKQIKTWQEWIPSRDYLSPFHVSFKKAACCR